MTDKTNEPNQPSVMPDAEMLSRCDAIERLAYMVGKIFMAGVESRLLLNAASEEKRAGRDCDLLIGLTAARITELGWMLAAMDVSDEALAIASPAMRAMAQTVHENASAFYAGAGPWATADPAKPASDKPQ